MAGEDTEQASDSNATRGELPGHQPTTTATLDPSDGGDSESTSSGGKTSTGGEESTTSPNETEVTGVPETTDPSETEDPSDTQTETGEPSESDGETETEEPLWENCFPDPDRVEDPFIDCVEAFNPADGVSFGHEMMPEIVFGSPEGGGQQAGSSHVAALGCGGSLVAFFDGPGIVDGPGADFIVFENPFEAGQTTFSEPAEVSVSDDLQTWHTFPCEVDGTGTWPATGCAGVHPVLANSMNGIDATNPQTAGGDAFDLADVGLSQAWFVRLVDVTEAYYGNTTWCGGAAGGFDLDAIAVVHEPEP